MNATLRYPLEAGGLSDYVTFTPMNYRSNAQGGSTAGSTRNAAPPSKRGAGPIVLYMPNSTPTISNGQSWANASFLGPLGKVQRDAAIELGDAANRFAGVNDFKSGIGAVDDTISGIVNQITKTIKSGEGQGALVQIGQNAAAGFLGVTANQQLALAQGKVYNPNVELLYDSPALRQFTMTFDFVPKSQVEAIRINDIIRNFKMWSAPADTGNNMFEIPMVWQVQYMTGSGRNLSMNQFKPAACTNVAVQANPNTPMHVAHFGGVPVITGLQLSFMEVNIIKREDHGSGMGSIGQGF